MTILNTLYAKARKGLTPYEKTPERALMKMASRCGRDEIAAIHIRLKLFRAERAMVDEWDGDLQDMIWDAINEHLDLLRFIDRKKPT
ncbi:hypothetical protein EGM70_04685 [Enterobacteriaceae bacterium 89]|nr:hypothetical protein [Enterobacteriaceae bacterium 89]